VRFAAEQRGSILAAAFATGETAYAALAGVSAPPSKHEEGSSPGPVDWTRNNGWLKHGLVPNAEAQGWRRLTPPGVMRTPKSTVTGPGVGRPGIPRP
jgi:hypothetical protein